MAWRRTNQPWSPNHDGDCSYRHSEYGAWFHWLNGHCGLTVTNLSFLLRLFLLLGADINYSVHPGRQSTILDVIILRLSDNPCLAREMLYTAAKQGAQPEIGSLESLLACARKASKQLGARSIKGDRKLKRRTKTWLEDGNDTAIKDIIRALEYYQNNDCKWPDLVPKSRRDVVPEFCIDVHNSNRWGDFDAFELYRLLKSASQHDFDPDRWLENIVQRTLMPNGSSGVFGTFVVVLGLQDT